MRREYVQMSLKDIYNDVSKSIENQKPALIEFLETYIDFEMTIPQASTTLFTNGMAEAIFTIRKALFALLCCRSC